MPDKKEKEHPNFLMNQSYNLLMPPLTNRTISKANQKLLKVNLISLAHLKDQKSVILQPTTMKHLSQNTKIIHTIIHSKVLIKMKLII